MVRIDYHVHPNFGPSRTRARRKAEKWWRHFAKHNLHAVVITEHAYKYPEETFRFLEKEKPEDSTTEVFPGVEALTKEGIDLVVFAETPQEMYRPSRLLRPYGLSYEDAVHEITERGLSAYVTHPSTFGTTSLVRHKGQNFAREMIARLGAVERHNSAFIDLSAFLDRFPRFLLGWLLDDLEERSTTPSHLYDAAPLRFWAGGSDAHHPFELGSYVEVASEAFPRNRTLWDLLHTTTDRAFIFRNEIRFRFALLRQCCTVFSEYLHKRKGGWVRL